MIRRAKHSDVPNLIPLGRHFHDASGYASIIPFSEAALADLALGMINNPERATIIVHDQDGSIVGMCGGMIVPSLLNQDVLLATELFWWVEEQHRSGIGAIRMLNAMEVWARSNGAVSLTMMTLDRMNADSIGRVYERLGFRPAERTYLKEL